jgi:DNA-binding PadR family transcriptional regulator
MALKKMMQKGWVTRHPKYEHEVWYRITDKGRDVIGAQEEPTGDLFT